MIDTAAMKLDKSVPVPLDVFSLDATDAGVVFASGGSGPRTEIAVLDVNQAEPVNPMFPHGCWDYHDFDPYNPAMPNGLIVMAAQNEPIRHWLEAGTNDLGSGGGPTTYRDFELANIRMAASYKVKSYHYHFDHAQGAGHLDGNAVAMSIDDAVNAAARE